MRARTVFLGDNVKDTWFNEAEMEGLGAAVPAMEDSRAIDAQALQPGYILTLSDADSAYLQAWLASKFETWAELPEEYWLPEWEGKYEKPVCPLVLALYGHEDSGGYWEEKSYSDIISCGWTKVEGRRGVFRKEAEGATLMVYVDDFKMACKAGDKDKLWDPLMKLIRLSPPTESTRYLGCYTERFSAELSQFAPLMQTLPCQWRRVDEAGEKSTKPVPWKCSDPRKRVQGVVYDMSQYLLTNVVDKYCTIAGITRDKLKFAATPFLDESKDPRGIYEPNVTDSLSNLAVGCESGDKSSSPSVPNKAQRKRLNRVADKCAAGKKAPVKPGAGFESAEGELCRAAASVCMTALYSGRLARFDQLRAIQRLAENFHKWTPLHTKKLHRLVEYINSTLHHKQYGFIGDPWSDLELALFVDADWASDNQDRKSTSGGLLVFLGPHSFFPIGAVCKKQGCQSLSTPEAEIVALTTILKEVVYPMLGLFEHIMGRKKVIPVVLEDNEATQKIVRSGKVDKAMGHVGRTHEIQIPWTADQFKAGNFVLRDCHTKAMAADVFTKYFTDPGAWTHALTLLSIFPQVKYEKLDSRAKGLPALASVPPFPVFPLVADGQDMGGVSSTVTSKALKLSLIHI